MPMTRVFSVYGVCVMHTVLHRRGHPVARYTAARSMRASGLCGATAERTYTRGARRCPGHPPGPRRACLRRDRAVPAVGRRLARVG
jgi:hypothetical protein